MKEFITILGKPEGKARPRVTQRGGFAKTYTPGQTVLYENYIKVEYQAQSGQIYARETNLKLTIYAYFDIPKNISKKKYINYLDNVIRPTKKPDADNIAKIYMDALNGVAYYDDSQVVEVYVSKLYGKTPRVDFKLEVL